jgi:hypothetical protein
MANQEHLDILKKGVDSWNLWREEHPEIKPDLTGANLRRINLSKANLTGVDLRNAYLRKTNLEGADLKDANLEYANLRRAYLGGANLEGTNTNLRRTNLSCANLKGTILRGTNLRRTNLSKADLTDAHLEGADLTGANLEEADLTGAHLEGADLTGATFVGTNLTGATLTKCFIYGISIWNVQLEGAIQDNLVITPKNEPTITVDNLKVAQFIYLLLNNRGLRDVLNAVTEKGVLLLGHFSDGGLEMLQSIASELRKMKYLPMLFDFERPDKGGYTETIMTLAGLARFVIADLSGPSVPQELYATVPHFKIPFVPIIEANSKPYSLSVDIFEYPWVVRPPITFTTIEDLLEQMPTRVIAPAEEKHQVRQKLLDELFNKA